MRSIALFLLALLVFPYSSFALNDDKDAPSGWTPEWSMKLKTVPAVCVSPDGKRVAFVVNSPVMAPDKSEYASQIHIANADGSDSYQLTFSEKSSANPQWSPDGKRLAFTSLRSGKNNLYVIRIDGGEAEQLTDVKSGVGNIAWSPDGRLIAFVMLDPPSDDEEKATKGKDDSRWIDENVKLNRLYVISIDKDSSGKREPRKLTAGDYNVGAGLGGGGSFDWSPDGKKIAFTHTKSPKANDWTTADVSAADVASGEVKPISNSAAAEFAPAYSPDGKWIAIVMSDNPPRWATDTSIHLIPAAGGAPKVLTKSYDSNPNMLGWSADGKRICFSEPRGVATRIYALDVNTNAITGLNSGNEVYGAIDLNRTGSAFGFAMQSSGKAVEAYTSRVDGFAPVQVSRVNSELSNPPVGKTEAIRWRSSDGMEIEGLLTYPVGYEKGKRVPLLLVIHGGPTGVFQQTFIGNPSLYPIATFASRGYAVLRPNPRGSSGYGKDFRFANRKDWGGGDYKDLMTGVDRVIEMGVADADRLGVMGWSYGGFMTSWIITQTKRFKVASVGAGVTNLMSFTGTADIPGFIPDYFGGQPWEDLEAYRTHSAMFNVKGVTTPTLIQHGEADIRVPISQGYELYNALKAQNVVTRMIVLPRQPHGPNEPKMTLKVLQTNLEWFDKYLGK